MAISPFYANNGTAISITSNAWSNSGSFVIWQQAVPQPEPAPPRLTMDEIAQRNLHFQYWEITPGEERSEKPFRKLARRGYRGVCVSDASPIEQTAIDRWLETQSIGDTVVLTKVYCGHERMSDYGSYQSKSRCFYAAPGPYAEIMALLDSFPKRPLVFRVQQTLHAETLRMLEGKNYHIIEVKLAGQRDRPVFYISVEDGVDVALIKLFSGPDA